jgi:hypothetical protein
MSNLPISGLPNLTATTNNSLLAIVSGGVTYNISILDFWKSLHPFGTMYQDWIPDAPSAHTIGSIAYPLKSVYVSTGSVFIGPNNSLAIDNSGVLYSTNVFAAPTFQVGNITSSGGVVSTSGYTFSVVNNQLYAQNNSGGTLYNLTQQVVPTGGTANQVLTRGSGTYGFGWATLPQSDWTSTGGTSQILNVTGTNGPTNVSIGKNVGLFTPPTYGVAIGSNAGESSQGEYGVAIGVDAGQLFQGTNAVAIGSAGYEDQGQYAIAIGSGAGDSGQGAYAIAIGAGAGANHQTAGSIIIDATNTVQSAAGAGLHIAPIRTGATSNNLLSYNTTSKEITYGSLTPTQVPTRYYGEFTSMSAQTNPVINQVNVMSADTTEHNNGVILSAHTRFVVQNAGVYNIQFSAQLQKTDNGDNTVYVWFRKNGTNISRSNTVVDVSKQAGGNGRLVLAWNLIETFNANDYVEIVWQSDDFTMSLATFPASGNYPATPSLIVTLTQV